MKPRRAMCMRWGSSYIGAGRIEHIGRFAVDALEDIGMEVQCERTDDDHIAISGICRHPWWSILLHGYPQRARFSLHQLGNEARLDCDWPFAAWYAIAIDVCWTVAAGAILATSRGDTSQGPHGYTAHFLEGTFLVCLGAIFLMGGNRLLLLAPGRWTSQVLERVRLRAEAVGCYLDPVGSGVSRRSQIRAGAILAFTFMLLLGYIWLSPASSSRMPARVIVLLTILGMLIGLLLAALAGMGRRGFTTRSDLAMPGLLGAGAALFYCVSPLLWLAALRRGDITVSQGIEMLRLYQRDPARLLQVVPDPQRFVAAIRSGELDFAIILARDLGWSAILCMVFLVGIALTLIVLAAQTALLIQPTRVRLLRCAGRTYVHAATSAVGFLSWFRMTLGSAWMVMAIVVCYVLVSGISVVMYVAFDVRPLQETPISPSLVDASQSMIGFTLEPYVSVAITERAVRLVWVVYHAIFASAVAFSVGSLVVSRRNTRKRLRSASVVSGRMHAHVLALVRDLSACGGVACPAVAISSTSIPYACAHSLGLAGRESWIEVSRGLIELLGTSNRRSELAAVLAHELGHLKARHCQVDVLVRLLGRLAFVGDGFVRAQEDSWGYEIRADAAAVSQFQIDPQVLKRALWRVRNAAATQAEVSLPCVLAMHTTVAMSPEYVKFLLDGPRALPMQERWALALRCFVAYYCGIDNTAYWHPSIDERVAALNAMSQSVGGRPLNMSRDSSRS